LPTQACQRIRSLHCERSIIFTALSMGGSVWQVSHPRMSNTLHKQLTKLLVGSEKIAVGIEMIKD